MTRYPRISVTDSLEQITIRRGETLTVVLAVYKGNEHYDFVNVELRVNEDGTREIFCDDLQCKPYSEWKEMV